MLTQADMTSIDTCFRATVAQCGATPFLHWGEQTLSYADCDALVTRATDVLATLPIPGRFIGLIAPNRPAFIIGFLAILRAGGRVVPINPRLGPDELRFIAADAHIPLILHTPDLPVPWFASTHDVLQGEGVALAATDIPGDEQGQPPSFPGDLAHVAVCIYTSGTTGRPKGALLTHTALLHNVRMCADGLGTRVGEECLVTVLPLFHAFAISACFLHAMCAHSRLLLVEHFQPVEVLRMMERHAATVFLGVPAMYAVLAQIDTAPAIPCWRLCISGGAPLPLAIAEAFQQRFGLQIHEGDGPTECGPAASVNPVDGRVKVGTIGVPLRGVEMKIVGDDLDELPNGAVGEIAVRSPSNFIGYLNQPGPTADTLRDGWVLTGDLGTRDDDGYFSIVDRKKDMLIVGGLNVYSREVEKYIAAHPAVAEVAVVGEPDGMRGEIPVACVVVREGRTLALPDLKAYLRARIAQYKIPRRLHIVEALPRNASGKVLKAELRGRYH